MILDPTTSMTRLQQFFSDTLPNNTLDVPDIIRPDTLTGNNYLSALVLNNNNIKTINFPNLVQTPYIITGDNLSNVSLPSLNQIEFNAYLFLNDENYLQMNFMQNTKIESLELPNFIGTRYEIPTYGIQIGTSSAEKASFRNNYWLKTVSMGNSLMNEEDNTSGGNPAKFNGFWFQNNYSLIALCLNYPYVMPIDRNEGLYTTPIDAGNGYIYVPSSLVSSYNTSSWQRFYVNGKIKSLDSYANDILAYNDTITDSWSQIISNCDNGGYGKYSVGDTKTLYVNGMPIQMVIVAKDFDTKENGTKAPLTWLMKTISIFTRYNLSSTFTDQNINFYHSSPLETHTTPVGYRDIFTKTIWDGLDETIKTGIKPVRKYSVGYEGASAGDFNNSILSIEKIWPPSMSELNISNYTAPFPYFSTTTGASDRPNYTLGLTNLIADAQNVTITVGTRDYSNTSTYPDVLRATSKTTRMEKVVGSNTNSYIIFGFCT